MKLLSVNVSLPKEVPHGRETVSTGIFKEPVGSRIMLRKSNLDGDGQADLENHGGVDRAAYAYSIENYDHWRRELGRNEFAFGQFGENFTVEGMMEDEVHIGDVFRVGEALVEVSQPRPPCFKLGIKMGMPGFPKLFLASGRVGFYLRVLEEGEVGAGDVFERVESDPERMSVREMSHLLFFEPKNLEGAKRALRVRALSPGWRDSFEQRLAKAGATDEKDKAAKKESPG
ncbi:MAG: MOSC domain-containing protein [Actinobacteria bacterium]|nr:MOSC domain-containing protein [Actinomycetota bacterium]